MSTTVLVVIGIAVAVVLLILTVRDKLKPTEEELHLQEGFELERRLASVTDPELRALFKRLAYGRADQQAMLRAALEVPEDAPETGQQEY